MLVVAALLLTTLTASNAAADDPEHLSKNAQKIVATLNMFGINDPQIRDFIAEANSHVKNGYVNLATQEVMGGELSFRYALSVPGAPRRLELNYAPEDSHVNVTARTDSFMVTYKLKF